jgi:putative copper resistance protein D
MLPKSPDPQATVLLFSWQTTWTCLLATVLELGALTWYVRAARRLAALGRPWPRVRFASFVVGLLVVAYAVEGGIAHYERSNFSAHVVQLLLLVDIAPPLLAIGSPLRLALQSSRGPTSTSLAAWLHSRPARLVGHPFVAFAAAVGTMYAYFLTPAYALSERHPVLLAYVELQFLVAGCLLWWVIVGRDALPRTVGFGARFILVFVSVPFNAFLGLAVASVTKPLFPAGNTLADTRAGGNVLWGLAEVFTVAALALLFVEWAREEERKAVRNDRQLDAALAVARSSAFVREPNPGA